MKIAIVADTSSNFTPKTAEERGVYIIPLQITIDETNYKDAIDLSTETFYQKMETASKLPTTSQPAMGEFLKLYTKLSERYDKILSIHPSSKLSGTVATAQMAANQVNPEKITVYDSEMVSILSGYLVIEALRLVDQGKSLEEILARLDEMKSRTIAYVMLEDFDNLIRSGRLPKLAGKATHVMQIKPILKISSKGIELERLVRNSKRALKKVEDMTYQYIDSLNYPVKVDVAHGNVTKTAKEVRDRLLAKRPKQDSDIHRLAAVIGVHTGPGIIGFTITPDYSVN